MTILLYPNKIRKETKKPLFYHNKEIVMIDFQDATAMSPFCSVKLKDVNSFLLLVDKFDIDFREVEMQ